MKEVYNFDEKTYCEEIGREAYGYVYFEESIPEDVAKHYELIAAGKKLWYSVTSAVYDDGRITAHITSTKSAFEKPENSCVELKRKTAYVDWFGSYEEAAAFVDEAKNA